MAGGSGTRFWPASRAKKPKQFLPLLSSKTLFEETLSRLPPFVKKKNILVVTQSSHVPLVRKLSGLSLWQVIGEPVGRNTAPCAILAALLAHQKDPKAVVALLPADHQITKKKVFHKLLKAAFETAQKSDLPITFGIQPDRAHSGYGYMELGKKIARKNIFDLYQLRRFHEKPSLQKAKKFLRSGNFLWNSGMFVWKAEALLKAAEKYLPEIYRLSEKIINQPSKMKKFFPAMPNISIDYGLMEKMNGKILTIPVDPGWSDVGGWLSFAEFLPQDESRNAAHGKAIFHKSSGNIVSSCGRLTFLLGMKDHMVIDTADALLICPKDHAESIREVIALLKKKKLHAYL